MVGLAQVVYYTFSLLIPDALNSISGITSFYLNTIIMKKFIIEREVPGAGKLSQEELRASGINKEKVPS